MCVWLLNSFLLGSQFFLDHETFKNNEASENQVDVEVDELESDDGEEELDTWNGFGWWGWQYFVEFLFLYPFIIPILCYVLNVHRRKKICTMENTSTSYLQQLLNSFPSMDASVDKKQDGESSDGEYQIYEQDNDENDLVNNDDWLT